MTAMMVTSRLGMVLKPGSNSTAFLWGRAIGMRRIASDAAGTIEALLDQLVQARGLVARLEAELEQQQRRYEHAQEMLRSTNRVVAWYEMRDGVTVH
jgi:hypothetical protein